MLQQPQMLQCCWQNQHGLQSKPMCTDAPQSVKIHRGRADHLHAAQRLSLAIAALHRPDQADEVCNPCLHAAALDLHREMLQDRAHQKKVLQVGELMTLQTACARVRRDVFIAF